MQKNCKKICTCQKKAVLLHPLSRNGAPDATQRSGRGGESGDTSRPVDLAERYRHHDLVAEREVP